MSVQRGQIEMATPAGFEPATFNLEGSRCLHDIKANSDIWVRFGPLSEIRNFRLSERARSAPVARARRRPNLKMIGLCRQLTIDL